MRRFYHLFNTRFILFLKNLLELDYLSLINEILLKLLNNGLRLFSHRDLLLLSVLRGFL